MITFQDILRDLRIPFIESGRGSRPGWVNLKCPFCEKDPYLGYNIAHAYCNCWNCGKVRLDNLFTKIAPPSSWQDIPEWIKELRSGAVIDESTIRKTTADSTKSLRIPPSLYLYASDYHCYYLNKRKLSVNKTYSLWSVGAIDDVPTRLRRRLLIPISFRDKVVSWTTRAVDEDRTPRYISAKDEESLIPISDLIYGIDYVRHTAIIVEGPIDVWTIGPGAVALLGQRVSPSQLRQLAEIPNRVVCFDSEPMAQKRARQLARDLAPFPGTTQVVVLESGKDANSADKEEVLTLRRRFLEWPVQKQPRKKKSRTRSI